MSEEGPKTLYQIVGTLLAPSNTHRRFISLKRYKAQLFKLILKIPHPTAIKVQKSPAHETLHFLRFSVWCVLDEQMKFFRPFPATLQP